MSPVVVIEPTAEPRGEPEDGVGAGDDWADVRRDGRVSVGQRPDRELGDPAVRRDAADRSRPASPSPVNHALPSGPAVIAPGPASRVGVGNSVTRPSVVMRAIRLVYGSVAKTVPSGMTAMPNVSPLVR
jgi:hypothetical protein